jgi:hypothetical protein
MAERLYALVEAYLRFGRDAELAGYSRRAAAYRSVANMLGVLYTGNNPAAVDFLARYPEPDDSGVSVADDDGSPD